MTRTKMVNGEVVELTLAENELMDAQDREWESGQSMRDWETMMRESDSIDLTRLEEDIIEFDLGGISQSRQGKYNSKKVKRSQRPTES